MDAAAPMTRLQNSGSNGPQEGDPMFVLAELEGPDGGTPRRIAFANAQVQPLDFASLRDARLDRPLTIPLNWRNATLVETTIEGTEPGQVINAAATLESPFTSCAIGLVKGGWLPSAFAVTHQNTTMMVDRNVVTQIVGRFDNGRRRRYEQDFLDLFADQPVRINPLLFVMEGNRRRLPTPAEAEAQMLEVEAKLRTALPRAEITVGPEHLKGALGLIGEARSSLANKQHFLRHLAPKLSSPVARADIEARWNDIIVAADLYNVPRQSLVVLAALSAVAVPNGKSPAKRLLKFRNGYTDGDAYNALADLRAIELFIAMLGYFPGEAIQLCTADKNLALFWVGIQASNFTRTGTSCTYDMMPVDELFPPSTGLAWKAVLERKD